MLDALQKRALERRLKRETRLCPEDAMHVVSIVDQQLNAFVVKELSKEKHFVKLFWERLATKSEKQNEAE